MKKYYSLVVSVLDKYDNRCEAIEVTGCANKREILKDRTQLKKEIKDGKYNKYVDFSEGETLSADIEVRDYESNDLLWIE